MPPASLPPTLGGQDTLCWQQHRSYSTITDSSGITPACPKDRHHEEPDNFPGAKKKNNSFPFQYPPMAPEAAELVVLTAVVLTVVGIAVTTGIIPETFATYHKLLNPSPFTSPGLASPAK